MQSHWKNEESKTVTVSEAAQLLGDGITREHIYGRIRRGSLEAYEDEQGNWHIPLENITQILENVEKCGNCSNMATTYLIIKYPQHNRIEFSLCDDCGRKAQSAYSRQGGVLEIVSFPLLSEAWLKP